MSIFHYNKNKHKKIMPHVAVAFIVSALLAFGICCLFFRPLNRSIETLSDTYVRSFTIMDNDIYFVSGYSYILRADLSTFEILETYPVPESISGMVQLTKIQDYFYITVSTDVFDNQDYATILRTRDLSELIDGEYEDIYDHFVGGGTPYYITSLDGAFYLTEHRLPNHSPWRFQVEDNEIVQVESLY